MTAEALSLQEEGTAARGMLEAMLASWLGFRGEYDEAQARLAMALKTAEDLGDDRLALAASAFAGVAADFNGHDGLPYQLRAAELAERLGDLSQAALAHMFVVYGLTVGRLDLDGAFPHAEKACAAADETRLGFDIVFSASGQAHLFLYAGRLTETGPLERAISTQPHVYTAWWALFYHSLFTADDSGGERALTLGEESLAALSSDLQAQAHLADIAAFRWRETGEQRWLDVARTWSERFLSADVMPRSHHRLLFPTLGVLALAANDPAGMEAWHDAAVPESAWRHFFSSIDLVRGLIDEQLGRDAEALTHYAEAMDTLSRSPTLWALPAYERARLLVTLGRPEASAAIDEVLEVTTRIGMLRWQEKALALRVQLHGVTGLGERWGQLRHRYPTCHRGQKPVCQ